MNYSHITEEDRLGKKFLANLRSQKREESERRRLEEENLLTPHRAAPEIFPTTGSTLANKPKKANKPSDESNFESEEEEQVKLKYTEPGPPDKYERAQERAAESEDPLTSDEDREVLSYREGELKIMKGKKNGWLEVEAHQERKGEVRMTLYARSVGRPSRGKTIEFKGTVVGWDGLAREDKLKITSDWDRAMKQWKKGKRKSGRTMWKQEETEGSKETTEEEETSESYKSSEDSSTGDSESSSGEPESDRGTSKERTRNKTKWPKALVKEVIQNVGGFSGSGKECTPEAVKRFGEAVILGARAANIKKEEQKIIFLGLKLKGTALQWFDRQRKRKTGTQTLEGYLKKLGKAFIPGETRILAIAMLQELTQEKNESIRQFGIRTQDLMDQAFKLGKSQRINFYVQGLLPIFHNEASRLLARKGRWDRWDIQDLEPRLEEQEAALIVNKKRAARRDGGRDGGGRTIPVNIVLYEDMEEEERTKAFKAMSGQEKRARGLCYNCGKKGLMANCPDHANENEKEVGVGQVGVNTDQSDRYKSLNIVAAKHQNSRTSDRKVDNKSGLYHPFRGARKFSPQTKNPLRNIGKIPALGNNSMQFQGTMNGIIGTLTKDGGADANIIGLEWVEKLRLKTEPVISRLKVKYANGVTTEVAMTTTVEICVGKWKRDVCFLIADIGWQCLLGTPFDESIIITKQEWAKGILKFTDTALKTEHTWYRRGTLRQTEHEPRERTTSLKRVKGRGEIMLVAEKEMERYIRSCKVVMVNVTEVLDDVDIVPPQISTTEEARDPKFLNSLDPVMRTVVENNLEAFDKPTKLPPFRSENMTIKLIPGSKAPRIRPLGHTSEEDLAAIHKTIPAMMEKGLIRPSTSEYGANMLFVIKSDGSRRLCVDYRALNDITVRNRTPIPNIEDMRASLRGAKYCTKIDLREGYYNVRIEEEDIHKTAFRTRLGLFEFVVMPFGLTGAPGVFSALINKVLGDLFDISVISYMDDILIFSKTKEEHAKHVDEVLKRMKKESLFCKLEKCEFMKKEVTFCGHMVSGEGVRLADDKVQAMKARPDIRKAKDAQRYLGTCMWFQRFIPNFATMTLPITRLLVKGVKWEWGAREEQAITEIIEAVTKAPILKHFDPKLETEVHCDASDYALGGMISQKHEDGEWHPVLFASRKLQPAELNYMTQEKECLALIYLCDKFSHYLRGVAFTANTDHESLKYLQRQEKLSRRQARWIMFLQEFDITLVHISGKKNVVADFLTRNPTVAPTCSRCEATIKVSQVSILSKEGEDYKKAEREDKECKKWREWEKKPSMMKKGEALWFKQISRNGDYWYFRKDRLIIPEGELRTRLLEQFHDGLQGGHQGMKRSKEKLARNYFWMGMDSDMARFVRSCDICQRFAERARKRMGKLMSLRIPADKFQDISIDFCDVPISASGDMLMVIVDRLSKMVRLVQMWKTDSAAQVAELFINNWYRQFGLPKTITSDRDSKFTSNMWKAVCTSLRVEQELTTARHQQANGQAEVTIRTVKRTARKYLTYKAKNWDSIVGLIEFALNDATSSTTGFSPFFLTYGVNPRVIDSGLTPGADMTWGIWSERIAIAMRDAREEMEKSQEAQAKEYDKNRKPDEGQKVGEWVTLDAEGISWQGDKPELGTPTRLGPFKITRVDSKRSNYTLDLPTEMARIHPVFHISKLERYEKPEDQGFKGRRTNSGRMPITLLDGTETYELEEIVDKRTVGRKNRIQYRCKWLGWPKEWNTWVGWFEGDKTWDADKEKIRLWETKNPTDTDKEMVPKTKKLRKMKGKARKTKSPETGPVATKEQTKTKQEVGPVKRGRGRPRKTVEQKETVEGPKGKGVTELKIEEEVTKGRVTWSETLEVVKLIENREDATAAGETEKSKPPDELWNCARKPRPDKLRQSSRMLRSENVRDSFFLSRTGKDWEKTRDKGGERGRDNIEFKADCKDARSEGNLDNGSETACLTPQKKKR